MLKGNTGTMKLEKQRQNENKYKDKTFLTFVKKPYPKKVHSEWENIKH